MEKVKLIEKAINKIDRLIREQLPDSKYQFELYDLITNTKYFRGDDEPFHWGSVYKLFLVAETIKMSEDGLIDMNNEILLRRQLFVNGNGIIKYLNHLDRLTFTDACKLTIAVSDNLCADELLDVVGVERLNNLFYKAGCKSSKLTLNLDSMVKSLFAGIDNIEGASFYHSKKYFNLFDKSLGELLKNNYTTASDVNTCFEFVTNSYLSRKGQNLLMQFILTPNVHTRIAACTFFSNYLLRGKTGALGFGIANSETAAIINKRNNEIKGYFTIITKGNRLRNFISNDIISLVGLEIVKLYEHLEVPS